jgi:hypothetical protein
MKYKFDEFDSRVLAKIEERKEKGQDYPHEKLFTELYEIDLSPTEARKELRGIENHLNSKKESYFSENKIEEEEAINKYKESIEIQKDGKQVSDKLIKMSENQTKDINFLLESHGYDVNQWELLNAKNNIWNIYSKKDGIQTLYSSKVTVKPKAVIFSEEWIKNVIEGIDFNKDLKKYNHNTKEGVTVEVNFADVHLGKFVKEIVASGEYNIDIAIERYSNAINETIERISQFNVKQIILPIGQDFINFDTLDGTTTKGTRQDMNEFYQTIYERAYETLLRTVETLRSISPVKVIYVKGNHDHLSTYTMCVSLYNLYKYNNMSDVEVDYSTHQRKYIKIGKSTLGLSHGENEKNRITNCMQTDVPELWDNKYRYFHLSHKHTEARKEVGGVVYSWLGSMSESCKWTYESGFVGSQKKGHVFLYDDEKGMFGEFYINV